MRSEPDFSVIVGVGLVLTAITGCELGKVAFIIGFVVIALVVAVCCAEITEE